MRDDCHMKSVETMIDVLSYSDFECHSNCKILVKFEEKNNHTIKNKEKNISMKIHCQKYK